VTSEKARDPRVDWSTSALLAEALRLAPADETRDSDELGDLLTILRDRGDRELSTRLSNSAARATRCAVSSRLLV
jgi:hypothetical protein